MEVIVFPLSLSLWVWAYLPAETTHSAVDHVAWFSAMQWSGSCFHVVSRAPSLDSIREGFEVVNLRRLVRIQVSWEKLHNDK
jgi:hypothetical protein